MKQSDLNEKFAILNTFPTGALICSSQDEKILYVNDELCSILRFDGEKSLLSFAGYLNELMNEDDYSAFVYRLNKDSELSAVYRFKYPDGGLISLYCSAKIINDPDLGEICELNLQPASVKSTSERIDPLTGKLTRRALEMNVDAKRARGIKNEAYLICFNILQFKIFNQLHGWKAGDEYLKKISSILESVFKMSNVCRIYADQFEAYYEGVDVASKIEKVHDQIAHLHPDFEFWCTAGIVKVSGSDTRTTVLIDQSMVACDSIPNNGLHYYKFYSDVIEEKAINKKWIQDNIDQIIQNGQLKVYFQPVIRSMSGRLCSVEALTRMFDSKGQMISPVLFIPALEERHLSYKVDFYVVEYVAKMLRERMDSGLPVVPVSVNISRGDFDSGDPVAVIEEAVKKYNLDRSMIVVEITESATMLNPDRTKTEVERIRHAGYEVWMDDFGSDYSSLNSLKDFNFNEIKLDMVFVRSLSEKSKKIITGVVRMAKSLGMHTLAEGVETQEQLDFLRNIGCEKIQGYYYGKPMPEDELIKRMVDLGIEFENREMADTYDKIGLVDVLARPSMGIFYGSDNPYKNSDFVELFSAKELNKLADKKYPDFLAFMNDKKSSFYLRIRRLCSQAADSGRYETLRLSAGRAYYLVIVKAIAKYRDGHAFQLVMIDGTTFEHGQGASYYDNIFAKLISTYEYVYWIMPKLDMMEVAKTLPLSERVGQKIENATDYLVAKIDPKQQDEFRQTLSLDYLEKVSDDKHQTSFIKFFRMRPSAQMPLEWKTIRYVIVPTSFDVLQLALCIEPSMGKMLDEREVDKFNELLDEQNDLPDWNN